MSIGTTTDWPPTEHRPDWLRRLRPHDTSARIRPLSGSAAFGEVATQVGLGPAGWAVTTAAGLVESELAGDPFLGASRDAEHSAFVEALALWAVLRLGGVTTLPRSLRDPVVAAVHDRVAAGVSLGQGLRCVRVVHASLSTALQDACGHMVPVPRQIAALRVVSTSLFEAMDAVSAVITREFAVETSRSNAGSAAQRTELVHKILDGEDVGPAVALRWMNYDLSLHHLALVLWSDTATSRELVSCAGRMLEQAGCSFDLTVPAGTGRLWAWGGRASGPPGAPGLPEHLGIQVAAGLPGEGPAGFRRSHEQAMTAEQLSRIGAPRTSGLHDYASLELVALLAGNLAAATEFVLRELDALAVQDESTAALRETVQAYLDTDRSIAVTAAQLHIAKNTVVYRVKKAERLRGRPLRVDRLRLHAALHLARCLGGAVLR
jgi:PucR C-terminal helix-turn-helix domain/GGDEF-like domain